MNPLRRSILSVPGHRAAMHSKAAAAAADVIMLDLEDSCPAAEKTAAREAVLQSLQSLSWQARSLTLRINAVDSPFALRDLTEIIPRSGGRIETVVVPKVDSPAAIAFVDYTLRALEQEAGLTDPIGIEAIIESARALRDADAIAAASPRLRCLVFGIADYSASINMPLTSHSGHGEGDGIYPGDPLHFVYSRLILSGKAAGLQVIDAPYGNFRDPEGLARAAARSRALGFDGKWAIHPAQLDALNAAFAPGADEIRRAREVVEAYDTATAAGRGAAAIGGSMIDHASLRMARDVLDRATRCASTSAGSDTAPEI
mgnify:CR=1 FL=1